MHQENKPNLPSKRINLIIFVIISMFPLLGMAIDLIAPSLPAISHSLNTSNAFSKNLISIYLFGLALGNFIIGFLSDTLGRRKLCISGAFIFMSVSFLAALFANVNVLLFARFLQGFTSAAFAVVARAVLSDLLSKERLIRVAATSAIMWGIGPIIGPMIGGYLQYYFGWQACFYFFAFYGLVGFIMFLVIVPETHFERQPLNIIQITKNFKNILTHRQFIGIATLLGLAYSLLIVFNTLGPFLIQVTLHHSPIYFGHVALFLGCTYLLGTLICKYLLSQFEIENILRSTLFVLLIITIIGLIVTWLNSKNIIFILILAFWMFLGCGIIYPMGLGKAMSLFRQLAGSGAAVMSLINILLTTTSALLMSFVSATSAMPLAWIYLALILLSCCSYWFLIRIKQ